MVLTTPTLLNGLSGFLVALLGIWMLRLQPRNAGTLGFGLFAFGLGLGVGVQNFFTVAFEEFTTPGYAVAGLLFGPTLAGLAILGTRYPRDARATPAEVGLAALPALFVVAFGLEVLGDIGRNFIGDPLVDTVAGLGGRAALYGGHAVMWWAVTLLALRARRAQPAAAGQMAVMAASLALFPCMFLGNNVVDDPYLYVTPVAAAALWLRAAAAGKPHARSLALLLLGAVLFAAIIWASDVFPAAWLYGLARVATVLLLSYAILRRQLLGIDVKVKWTLKQSTVAAAFIGVFFIVSESASTFFAEEGGLGAYMGIAAAGFLVFVMAPLQRAAEGIANAAMPGVKAAGEMSRDERAAVYRDAALQAWSDGSLDRNERALLDRLQGSLGLDRDEAMRIEQEAARSGGPGDAAGA
jgi:hypothetical protein